jgi:hypothetical protein
LEELEQEELDERLLDVAGTAQLPSVPDTEVPVPAGIKYSLYFILVFVIAFPNPKKRIG